MNECSKFIYGPHSFVHGIKILFVQVPFSPTAHIMSLAKEARSLICSFLDELHWELKYYIVPVQFRNAPGQFFSVMLECSSQKEEIGIVSRIE